MTLWLISWPIIFMVQLFTTFVSLLTCGDDGPADQGDLGARDYCDVVFNEQDEFGVGAGVAFVLPFAALLGGACIALFQRRDQSLKRAAVVSLALTAVMFLVAFTQ